MTDLHARRAKLRLDTALDGLDVVFRGAAARPEEHNCECHWGSAEELAILKVPGVRLDPDLLRRTWQAPDWSDHGSVLRRVLPQLAGAVVDSRSESFQYQDEIGVSLARGRWQSWSREQAAAVWEFLHAFWAYSLVTPAPAAQAHQTLVLCVEASGELSPWLNVWETLEHPIADQNLAEAVEAWDYDLLVDELLWSTWHDNADGMVAVLTAWLTRQAPTESPQRPGRPASTPEADRPGRARPLARSTLAQLHLLTIWSSCLVRSAAGQGSLERVYVPGHIPASRARARLRCVEPHPGKARTSAWCRRNRVRAAGGGLCLPYEQYCNTDSAPSARVQESQKMRTEAEVGFPDTPSQEQGAGRHA